MNTFKRRNWHNSPDKTTPIHQNNLNDLEARVATSFEDLEIGLAAVPPLPAAQVEDVIPPTQVILTPAGSGETIFGDYVFQATSVDNPGGAGVFLVAFRFDDTVGAPYTILFFPGPYSFLVDTTMFTDGQHTMYVRGLDFAGNVSADVSVTFNVDNTAYLADSGKPKAIRARGYNLVFEENFDTLDRTMWNNKIWYDGDPDPAWLADGFQEVQSGILHQRTKRSFIWHNPGAAEYGLPTEGPYPLNTMTTMGHFQFQYGYIEARMKWTDGKGVWPGFWLYSYRHSTNPDYPDVNSYCANHGLLYEQCASGEIDIFEGQGGPTLIGGTPPLREWFFGTIHRNSGGPYRNLPLADTLRPDPNSFNTGHTDLTADFHTYAVLWTPTKISWYLDGLFLGSADPFVSLQQPMYILLDMWVGGWSWPLNWTDPAETPDVLDSQWDWIHVYQQTGDFHSFS
jgi:beta-glucanase (GH16 family)